MKRFFVVTLLAIVAITASAQKQKYNWKRAALSGTAGFTAGAAWGLNQVLSHHNQKFMDKFPRANQRFWGPESWRNKYWQFDPEKGRNTTPIWFTDGLHLTASTTQVAAFGCGVVIVAGKRRPWWHYVLDAGICFAGYSAGNFLTYDLIKR